MKILLIECCACGVEMPDKIADAVDSEEESRIIKAPIIGLVCDKCKIVLSE